jgi:hypothetical protein
VSESVEAALKSLAVAADELRERQENESETRHKLIDVVLHDILTWPRNRLFTEEYIKPGFADYVLRKANGDDLLFIEAKRAGVYFELPRAAAKQEVACYIPVQLLITDTAIKDAMTQVRVYCVDSGCKFAAITNGHEWIFFKTFEDGKRWDALQAFVIRSERFFIEEYTRAYNALSYNAIIEDASLTSLLTSAPPKDRAIFYAKDRIPAYEHTINANRLATSLRPIVNHYFGTIGDDETEFMDRCYVSQRDYRVTLEGMRTMMEDAVSPYLEGYGIQQLDETGKGGRIGGRLTKNIRKGRKGEVLVLFGGKGAGKSTFIKRLLHHNPPPWLRDHSVIAIIDLLKVPEEVSVIRGAIWDGLVDALDKDKLLETDRSNLLQVLFADRYAVALRQELSGLRHGSDSFNTGLNALVSAWKADKRYCASRLVDYWKEKGRGIIVVIDNTDQYTGPHQDFCFTSAQDISDALGCITLISMREERFYNSKIHGVLDAFQNAGFHISSPRPADVFRKRLSYTTMLLDDTARRDDFMVVAEDVANDCSAYLNIINREFRNDSSPLNACLTACAHGDTRLSLDLFRSFLLSGYTNVEEMLTAGKWNFQVHQIIKPVMIPNRYFYDEKVSDIPNIYQLRYSRHSSHFTALRVLRKLDKIMDGSSQAYMPVAQLKAYFVETFNMLDDLNRNLDMLLKHGFIESNNRLDSYSDDVDSIKITAYGRYMFRDLAYFFSYLDLVCTDSGVFDQSVSNYLTEAANEEYNLFIRNSRQDRVKVRLGRVEQFIKYLHREECRENDHYHLEINATEMFTYKTMMDFEGEKKRVLASAERQLAKWGDRSGRARRGGAGK